MAKPNNIVLIGMPAVGKSTIGVLLAKRIGYSFIDTDLLIQSGEKHRLQQIIQMQGVERFCDIESAYVQKVLPQHTVVATGGSVIYRSTAMRHLQSIGEIIFLDISLRHLKTRLNSLDTRGVVYLPGQSIDTLYAERRPLYRQFAQHRQDCTDMPPEGIVQSLISKLGMAVQIP